MHSVVYDRCPASSAGAPCPLRFASTPESDDDDVFVDIDGDVSDCDVISSSSTCNWSGDADDVNEKRHGNAVDPVVTDVEHSVAKRVGGDSDSRSTGKGAIFSLALFASSILQSPTAKRSSVAIVSAAEATNRFIQNGGDAKTLRQSQPRHLRSRMTSPRCRRRQYSQSPSSLGTSTSRGSVSPTSPCGSSNDDDQTMNSLNCRLPVCTTTNTSVSGFTSAGQESFPQHCHNRHHYQQQQLYRHPISAWWHQSQRQLTLPDVVQLPVIGGEKQLSKTACSSFLIEEILRPDFGVHGRQTNIVKSDCQLSDAVPDAYDVRRWTNSSHYSKKKKVPTATLR